MSNGQNNNDVTFSSLRDTIIGPNKHKREMMIVPRVLGATFIQSKEELFVQNAMESCVFKSALSGVAGFALGGALGLFSASVGPEATMHDPATQTVKQVFKDMGSKSFAYAKNFAILGLVFAATECAVESVSGYNY